MTTMAFINRLQPADGKRDALIDLLREFADPINADAECLHYSVHEPIDDEAAPLTVIQAYTSVAGRPSISRDTVGSDATRPNTAGSARSTATSARQSPPRASDTGVPVAFTSS